MHEHFLAQAHRPELGKVRAKRRKRLSEKETPDQGENKGKGTKKGKKGRGIREKGIANKEKARAADLTIKTQGEILFFQCASLPIGPH